jgi:outer membrane protein TolC
LLRVAGQDDLSEEDVDRLYRIALAQRSDVRQLDATITLEGARLSAEKADYYPKLSLFSSYDITAQENGGPNFFGESGNQRSTAAVAGLRLEVPIFTGFSRDAQVQQARATVRQNEARRDRLALETASQLRTLRESVGEARARTVAQQRAVAQARRGFEIASAEYRAGVGSQLQITDAEVALRESEFNYAQAVYDYLSGRARLEAAAGVVPYRAGDLAQQYENQ